MRLILGAQDTTANLPKEQWVLFNSNGTFSIAAFVLNGYDHADIYAIGGGGGGGGGGAANTSSPGSAGGGGGGGGGGGMNKLLAVPLVTLDTNTSVVIGQGGSGGTAASTLSYGGDGGVGTQSKFGDILIGHPGGGSGGGSYSASVDNPAHALGGPGGAGGGKTVDGQSGTNNIFLPGQDGGVGAEGGGHGGASDVYVGTVPNGHFGSPGTDGAAYMGDDNFGGGGGGGGGAGISNTYISFIDTMSGAGGDGDQTTGNEGSRGYGSEPGENGYNDGYSGGGGGGGGGCNLSAITDKVVSNIDYGRGGDGGRGGTYGSLGSGVPFPKSPGGGNAGKKGCVLIRVYATGEV